MGSRVPRAARSETSETAGAAALPLREDSATSENAFSFSSVLKLFLRSWPFLHPEVEGSWRGGSAAGSYAWMPPALTAAFLLSAWSGAFDSGSGDAAVWGSVALGASLVTVCAAWATLAARGRWLVAASVLGATSAALAVALSWTLISGFTARLCSVGLGAIFAAAWFVRIDRSGPKPALAVRTRSHLLYYYGLIWLSRGIDIIASAFTIGLLYQNILIGEALTPFAARLLRVPQYSNEVVQRLGAEQRVEVMYLYIVALMVIFFVQLPFRALLPYYNVWILQRINQSLRLALLERWQRLSLRYHSSHRVGDSIYRIYQDSAQVTAVIGRLLSALTELSSVAICVGALAFLSPPLAGLALLIGAPVLGWGRWFSPRIRTRSLVAREANSDLTSRIQETVTGVRVIKAYGAEAREQARFEADSVRAFDTAFSARSLGALVTIVSFTFTVAFLLTGEYWMALWARGGQDVFASSVLLLFGVAFARWNVAGFNWGKGQLFSGALNVRGLSRDWALGQDMAMGLHRVFDILDIEPDVQDAPNAIPMPAFRDSIRFESVRFGYAADQPILKDVSFSAGPGSITAIVGPTGAGKTTLVTLLLRLFDPDAGRVSIDGRDLRELQVESLREHVAIALQENLLFDTSVADNIRYVATGASDAQVREAARVACADEFIDALPQGYDTELGNRGGKLSSGQRQRISIARAIIKNTPILVLDEPTAALDAETEHRVLRNLANWGKDRAIFIITHRLSTIRQADQILYLESGELREIGRHDELMRAAGRYRNLVEAEELLGAGERPAAAVAAR